MKNLNRVLDLIKKTGDRFIFEDTVGELFVIQRLDDYENTVLKNNQVKYLSEEELLNKLNKDIALWKASQEEENIPASLPEVEAGTEEEQQTEDQFYLEPVDDDE